jgi:NAD(P)-dependent dehydrogenase (short-subunit alcohol dehydrogenase family)
VVALETAGSGVTCNAVCPGWVLTPLVQAQIVARAAKAGTSVKNINFQPAASTLYPVLWFRLSYSFSYADAGLYTLLFFCAST